MKLQGENKTIIAFLMQPLISATIFVEDFGRKHTNSWKLEITMQAHILTTDFCELEMFLRQLQIT